MRTYTSCCGSLLLYQCCRDVNVWNVIRSCGVVGKTPGGPCRHDDVSFVTTHLFQEEYILGEGVPLDPPARGRVVLERDSHHITIRMRGFPAGAAGTHFFSAFDFLQLLMTREEEEEEETWVRCHWRGGALSLFTLKKRVKDRRRRSLWQKEDR